MHVHEPRAATELPMMLMTRQQRRASLAPMAILHNPLSLPMSLSPPSSSRHYCCPCCFCGCRLRKFVCFEPIPRFVCASVCVQSSEHLVYVGSPGFYSEYAPLQDVAPLPPFSKNPHFDPRTVREAPPLSFTEGATALRLFCSSATKPTLERAFEKAQVIVTWVPLISRSTFGSPL